MKKKKPELNFSPQANMLHLLKSAKSVALSSPKRNTVLLQPSILDVMTGKGTRSHTSGALDAVGDTPRGDPLFSTLSLIENLIGFSLTFRSETLQMM